MTDDLTIAADHLNTAKVDVQAAQKRLDSAKSEVGTAKAELTKAIDFLRFGTIDTLERVKSWPPPPPLDSEEE